MIADEIARLRDHLSKRQREHGCYQVRVPNPKKPERREYYRQYHLKNAEKRREAARERHRIKQDAQAQRT